ncbi:MAG: HD domain-containing phosphohydrolase [Planctomycetota bacterium]
MCELDRHGRKLDGPAGFVDDLVTAMVNRRIYSADHPRVGAAVDAIVTRLDDVSQQGDLGYTLSIADGYLVHDERPLLGATLSANRLIQALEGLGAGGLQFARGAGVDDVRAVLQVLSGGDSGTPTYLEGNAHLDSLGGKGARLLPPFSIAAATDGSGDAMGITDDSGSHTLATPVQLYQGVVDALQGITIDVCRSDQFSLSSAETQLEAVLGQIDQDPKTMLNLACYEAYDAFTYGHSIRVSFLAMTFARALTSDQAKVLRIGMAALMHDVGKARVPFELLQSRTRLSKEERREMERHTEHGAAVLLELQDADPWAVTTAFGHHRTRDRRGYPRMACDPGISTVTKLVKICDVYEALTAVRPYKPGMSPTRAYRIMMSMRGHFEPGLLRLFVQINGIYAVGTEVTLSNGYTARVDRQTPDLLRPVVVLERSPEGEPLHECDRAMLDLSQENPLALAVVPEHDTALVG